MNVFEILKKQEIPWDRRAVFAELLRRESDFYDFAHDCYNLGLMDGKRAERAKRRDGYAVKFAALFGALPPENKKQIRQELNNCCRQYGVEAACLMLAKGAESATKKDLQQSGNNCKP